MDHRIQTVTPLDFQMFFEHGEKVQPLSVSLAHESQRVQEKLFGIQDCVKNMMNFGASLGGGAKQESGSPAK